jgi:hypothetical protein
MDRHLILLGVGKFSPLSLPAHVELDPVHGIGTYRVRAHRELVSEVFNERC